MEKNEETRNQIINNTNLNEIARQKLRKIILEEAQINKERKNDLKKE